MAKILLTALLISILMYHRVSGKRCRFATTSANQGPCIFPCRCTKGCNTDTGECINGGQCIDGHLTGIGWTGTACQISMTVAIEEPTQTPDEKRLTWQSSNGQGCRFARTSVSQGSCLFACHCTKGCDTNTGQCINGGQCDDGHLTYIAWTGPACQTSVTLEYEKPTQKPGERRETEESGNATAANQAGTVGLGTGPWIGIATATFILGVVAGVIVILRMRSNRPSTEKDEYQGKRPTTYADVVGYEQNYDHVWSVPGERSDVYALLPV